MSSSIKTILPQVVNRKSPKIHTGQKLVSPTDSEVGKHSRRNKTTLYAATYNTRTLSSDEKLNEFELEIQNIKWDVIGLSETKRKGEELLYLKSGHALYYVGENDIAQHGVGILIHKKLKDNITVVKAISKRVIYAIIKLNNRYDIKFIQDRKSVV